MKVLAVTSLCLVISEAFSAPCHLNQYGLCDIPDSTLAMRVSDTIKPYVDEPLSQYGNPSYYRVGGKKYHVLPSSANYDRTGIASWYGKDFQGKLTANRETFNMFKYSAASKTLPIPSYVRVTNLANGKSLVIRVNDRGPYIDGRLIDLSYAAARDLGFAEQGITQVRVTTLDSNRAPRAEHYLQIGAFSVLKNARRLKNTLEAISAQAVRIHPANHPSRGTVYRVEVGPFDNSERLQAAQQAFQAKGYQHTIAILG